MQLDVTAGIVRGFDDNGFQWSKGAEPLTVAYRNAHDPYTCKIAWLRA